MRLVSQNERENICLSHQKTLIIIRKCRFHPGTLIDNNKIIH